MRLLIIHMCLCKTTACQGAISICMEDLLLAWMLIMLRKVACDDSPISLLILLRLSASFYGKSLHTVCSTLSDCAVSWASRVADGGKKVRVLVKTGEVLDS